MTGLFLAAAAMALLSGLRAALRLNRERLPMVAASAFSMLASGAVLILAAIIPGLLRASSCSPVIAWASAILGLAATWAFLGMLAAVTGEGVSPVVYWAIPAAGVALAGVVQAVLEGAGHGLPSGLPAAAGGLVVLFCHCPALGRIAVLAWRWSRYIPVRHIGLGMRAVAAAATAEIALVLARSAEIMLAACGMPACGPGVTALAVAQGVAAIQLIAGVTAPAWFSAAASASRQCRMWVAWCRLRPLWALLLEAAPEIRLPPQPGTRLNPRYHLHRRVIEIRDAELALRPFGGGQAARKAACAARSAGLPPDEHDAVIEAVIVMTALGARQSAAGGRGPGGGHFVSEPHNDLQSEAARLLLVARAIRHSPIVRQAAAPRSPCRAATPCHPRPCQRSSS